MHGPATCNIYPLPIFSYGKSSASYPRTQLSWQSIGSISGNCWFEPAVRHYCSSNNVRLFAYVFTGGDLQLERMKHKESNRVNLFQTRFLSIVYL